LIGETNSPSDWRAPMVTISSAAAVAMPATRRVTTVSCGPESSTSAAASARLAASAVRLSGPVAARRSSFHSLLRGQPRWHRSEQAFAALCGQLQWPGARVAADIADSIAPLALRSAEADPPGGGRGAVHLKSPRQRGNG
jgi:hypothetical protein